MSKQSDRKALAKARRDAELEDMREGRRQRSATFASAKDYRRRDKHKRDRWDQELHNKQRPQRPQKEET